MSKLAIDVDGLRPKIGGEVITPEDSSYDEARRVWNGMIDRHPALIVRCASTDDVVAAVNFGRDNGLRDLSARRRALDARLQHLRRRDRDRPPADERRRGRPRGANGSRAGRRHLGRPRRRHAGARACRHRRARLRHRRRRPRARQRQRLAGAHVRSDLREPAVGRGRVGRRQRREGERRRERRPVLGTARRRRQLRRRDRVRVPPAPRRPDPDGRDAGVPARAGARGHARLPRLHRRRLRSRSAAAWR